MGDDVILSKSESLERCLERIADIYQGNPKNLHDDLTRQDAILLNLERACQATIDMAMRLVRKKNLGIPKETREAFDLLERAKVIPTQLSVTLKKMVGFRNIAIHDYQALDLGRVQSVIEKHLKDLREFSKIAIQSS